MPKGNPGQTKEFLPNSGIRLTRDSGVSVVYAEGLNSTTSSVILQRTDRHGFWDKSLQIFKSLL